MIEGVTPLLVLETTDHSRELEGLASKLEDPGVSKKGRSLLGHCWACFPLKSPVYEPEGSQLSAGSADEMCCAQLGIRVESVFVTMVHPRHCTSTVPRSIRIDLWPRIGVSFLSKRYKNECFKNRPIVHCVYCGEPLTRDKATVDHATSLARDGAHHRENLVIACRPCNQAKGDLTAQEFLDRKVVEESIMESLSGLLSTERVRARIDGADSSTLRVPLTKLVRLVASRLDGLHEGFEAPDMEGLREPLAALGVHVSGEDILLDVLIPLPRKAHAR